MLVSKYFHYFVTVFENTDLLKEILIWYVFSEYYCLQAQTPSSSRLLSKIQTGLSTMRSPRGGRIAKGTSPRVGGKPDPKVKFLIFTFPSMLYLAGTLLTISIRKLNIETIINYWCLTLVFASFWFFLQFTVLFAIVI